MWKTQFNVGPRVPVRAGSKFIDEKVLKTDNFGCQVLITVGKKNIYDFIQSHKDSCDLNFILNHLDKASVNGLESTFKYVDLKESGIIDLTCAPKNIGDMLNVCNTGRLMFDGLPLEVRREFNFSAENFIKQFGTKEFNDCLVRSGVVDNIPDKPAKGKKKKVEETVDE